MSNVFYKQDTGKTMTVRVTSNDRGPRGEKGETGADGVSVNSLSMDANEHLIGHLSNGQTTDAGEIPKALSQRIDLGVSDGQTYEFPISPAIDPAKAGYILLNGVIYTDEFEVNEAGNKLTLSFEEGMIPSGKLQLIVNDTGIVSKTSTSASQVKSVNGKTGVVRLTAADVKALPNTTKLPTFTSDLINNSDFKTGAQVQAMIDASGSGGVTSVNGKQGIVVLAASDLQNDSGYQTSADVATAISGKANTADLATVATSGLYNDLQNKPTLANVATSGDYSDLSNRPTLATVATSGSYSDLSNKPTLATVASSGSYNDLTDKPTIPASVTVDSTLSSVSENPVQNRVIYAAIGNVETLLATLINGGGAQ